MFFFSSNKRQYYLFAVWLFWISTETLTLISNWDSYCQGLLRTFLTFIYFLLYFGKTKCLFKTTERMSYLERNWSWIRCAICLNDHGLKQTAGLGWVAKLVAWLKLGNQVCTLCFASNKWTGRLNLRFFFYFIFMGLPLYYRIHLHQSSSGCF